MISPTMEVSPGLIVGVGGQFNAGKDELSDYLAAALNGLACFGAHKLAPEAGRLGSHERIGVWQRNAFAAGVKQVFCDTFGVDLDFVEKWKRNPLPPPGFAMSVRDILIAIGDGFRKFRPDVWINKALSLPGHQVLSDARYRNEMWAIKERDGVTILLWRPGHENDTDNASEQDLMPILRDFVARGVRGATGHEMVDFFLVNDGGVDDLHRQADAVVIPHLLGRLGLPL